MSLSAEEQAYLDAHKLRRLTFDGINDLYLSLVHGSVTLARAIELDEIQRIYRQNGLARTTGVVGDAYIPVSGELDARNERCIDEHGCGMFGG